MGRYKKKQKTQKVRSDVVRMITMETKDILLTKSFLYCRFHVILEAPIRTHFQ